MTPRVTASDRPVPTQQARPSLPSRAGHPTCATPDCATEACGWIGIDDAPTLTPDADDRVWLCERCIGRYWQSAARGHRPPMPGQTTLNLGDAA